jgi:hypothetical protein
VCAGRAVGTTGGFLTTAVTADAKLRNAISHVLASEAVCTKAGHSRLAGGSGDASGVVALCNVVSHGVASEAVCVNAAHPAFAAWGGLADAIGICVRARPRAPTTRRQAAVASRRRLGRRESTRFPCSVGVADGVPATGISP